MRRRVERVNDIIEEQVSVIIPDIVELKGVLVTVQEVRTSIDLHHAQVIVSALPEKYLPQIMKRLEKRVGYIQKILNGRLRMRPVPKLRFVADTGSIKEKQVLDAIRSTEED